MASKDERPGLLSKVALFVRNPTKDWSELDQPQEEQESAFDRQALKAMIERKRQNDFVRKREFDQLRRLRNRDPMELANAARPSFFQNSLPIDDDGREVTLKKIDEIEAQMSKQWWKGKADSAAATGATGAAAAGTTGARPTQPLSTAPAEPGDSVQTDGDSVGHRNSAFPMTQPLEHAQDDPDPSDFAPTVMATGPMSLPAQGADLPDDGATPHQGLGLDDFDFAGAAAPAAADDHELATDPELEEAAIRFANGDDSGAEGSLLAALRGNHLEPGAARAWAAALLDLYRATQQRARFDAALLEFSLHLFGTVPVWVSLARPTSAAADVEHTQPSWQSPGVLTLEGVEAMRDAMAALPAPWWLDWSQLHRIQPAAMPLLEALFESLVDENVPLAMSGGERLVHALRVMTPSGESSLPETWWHLRMNVLRVLRLRDDYELAALDFSVTYEHAPPVWQAARCQCELIAAASPTAPPTLPPSAQATGSPVSPAAADQGLAGSAAAASQGSPMALRGEVLGDALAPLEALDVQDRLLGGGGKLIIQCEQLLRVDFAAAGSILNWVIDRHAQGRQIQFVGVHRLVAAFFYVIGINEYAKVVPRPI